MKNNLDITKPRQYSEEILPVPWPFVIHRGSTAHVQIINWVSGNIASRHFHELSVSLMV